MSQATLQFTEDQYEKIGKYVRTHFHQWLLEDKDVNGDAVTGQLNRIETSLEASIVLSRERFEQIDHRFERMDQRFELMDKRFEEQMEFTLDRFALVDKHFKLMEDRFVEQKELSAKQYSLMDKRLDETNGRLKNQFAIIITVTGVILTAVIGVLIQGYLG